MAVLESLSQVADAVLDAAASVPRALIGITGSPGAGKTTVGTDLVALLGPTAHLLSMDGFHLPQARLVELGRRDRMGAPDTFDVDGFLAILHLLRRNETVTAPAFDRVREQAVPAAVTIPGDARIVVVEGNYLLLDSGGWERVGPLLDLSLFVGIDRDIRLSRLIERHERFGKSPEDAAAWASGPDDANAGLIEGTAARAHHLIRLSR